MNAPLPTTGAFKIGPFVVVPAQNLIFEKGQKTRVEGKVMGILVTLAKDPGQVVSKADLLSAVWPGRVVVDGVLKRGISELRKILGDSAGSPRFIETVPGVGYRLCHGVEVAQNPADLGPTPAPRLSLAIGAPLVLVALGVVVWLVWNQAGPTADDELQNTSARELYVRGKHLWASRTGAGIRESIRYFDEALKIEPTYAQALAAKGAAYVILSNYSGMDHTESMRLAWKYTSEALRLNPQMGEATAVLGNLESSRGDQVRALELYERAITLDPNSAPAHQWFGGFLVMMGYVADGAKLLDRAFELEPMSGSAITGQMLLAAIREERETLLTHAGTARSIGAVRAGLFAAIQALRDGELDRAVEIATETYEARGWHGHHLRQVMAAHLNPALRAGAVQTLEAVRPVDRARQEEFYFEWALLGEADRAIAALQAITPPLLSAKLWLPENAPLHRHPQFIPILARHHGYGPLWRSRGMPDICLVDNEESEDLTSLCSDAID